MRITGDEMARIDKYAINVLEIPSILLMENAALALLKHIDLVKNIRYCIVCGNGNNGADGLALARHLINYDHEVEVIILGKKNENNIEFMTYYKILRNLGVNPINLTNDAELEEISLVEDKFRSKDLIVDAIFGTGLNNNISGIYEYVIDMINNSGKKVLSVDIPSGIDSNDGRIHGVSVDADTVVTFQFMKEGLFVNKNILGDVYVEPISIPKKAIKNILK